MLSKENRALVERFIDPDCYDPNDTRFGFTDKGLNALLDAARREGIEEPDRTDRDWGILPAVAWQKVG